MGQGMIPTATSGPEATTDIHKLYPLPLIPLFLHLLSALQLAWVGCFLLKKGEPLLCLPSSGNVAVAAHSAATSGMETSRLFQ